MKFFFQCILIVLFILIIVFSYNKYFLSKNKLNLEIKYPQNNDELKIIKDKLPETNNEKLSKIDETNNLIKNLKYEVKLSNNRKYIINSDLSELKYINQNEIIEMKNVEAIYIDKKKNSLVIMADEAIFNSSNNNTSFKKNIKIAYQDNNIFSENADINFIENTILIYENTLYKNPRGIIKTDNIKIDLTTKNVYMFMNDSKNKVKVKSN